ncbi:hypothetical protein [Chryseobacterium sp. FH2]|uniref:hypothetical protein n=1 Tax=Chryseobacterium sp. FH2 TaxID=1674291 RepID=UPI00065B01B6|nr:hypothetical protein [Chryseobacterium sp. FH2]
MKAKKVTGIPSQKTGGFHDTESERVFENSLVASEHFDVLKKRFLSTNSWKDYCGEQSADFKLYDHYGNYLEREPQTGDFIRIDIPGPGETEAKGYDWVKINSFFNEKGDDWEKIFFICNPSEEPGNKKNRHIAHFYSKQASSTFMILREANFIRMAIYGRNETPNFNANFLDIIRNIFTAVGGMLGIAKIQWKCLADGLIDF